VPNEHRRTQPRPLATLNGLKHRLWNLEFSPERLGVETLRFSSCAQPRGKYKVLFCSTH